MFGRAEHLASAAACLAVLNTQLVQQHDWRIGLGYDSAIPPYPKPSLPPLWQTPQSTRHPASRNILSEGLCSPEVNSDAR
ncbi:hypothetical protein DUNSADRAFT_15021 [Dunaliella salina]|uniref:Encoded protein n=1 Tax=Dunaliella salina TaxID=3046 RepID=A0ABQ7G670_DUNSA|nr:hypothetical protein DUNSADRAFT_15021 [Dunaliella salina]|eukprot:KAF5830104.1 hypothetical protein DUNSADRAFT_15021 [Dunaliella salina]